ncbi:MULTISPECIES: class I SAM-dependent methyltransferase [Bacillus]|uniref:class I SAM-dependent methyltransferase n=1 Tax=Bacillus TaxID=1386 RepID=UPI000992A10A|nr:MULTISPECIES: rRNA adenine N-6-methyltransferase family protein [Bacillus cereus group]OOR15288.1 SAM-dependent methyltransferase [Bacillus mycoides]OOR53847.1 SAM-dependent methyltransferase [Bacillus mycoides]QWG76644.1 SAM-dependent methyltransferase [Bacillus mycoides]QWG84629.1 SAM-dependent methyltransferase [Bacillus mycoides]TXR69743.1 SAM-dependent methyltransferase [Bacillus sp. AR13-1]
MKHLSFLSQCITNPRNVGAVLPSSKFLAEKMMENINFENAKYIIEYGPGTGVFTEKLLKKRNSNTTLMLVENNREFYLMLKEKFKKEKNLFIVWGSAENIDKYLKNFSIPYADYIVSGLPFASLPQNVSDEILLTTTKILKKDGVFITFQYTKFKKKFLNQFFDTIDEKWELRNVPPAFVFSCSTPKNKGEKYGS